jgi:hypothetical protein
MTEYPHIARQIRAVALASPGNKRAKQKRLIKMRLSSLRREMGSRATRACVNPVLPQR